MCKYFSMAATLVVAFLLHSCKQQQVALDYTSAKGEVQPLTNLVFRFDKALVPDSLLNRWDSADYISFEPQIPGRFRWEAPDQLVFSPSRPLLPATRYKASVRNEVLRFSRIDKVAEKEINFHTADLQLTGAQVSWVLPEEGAGSAVPQFEIGFNYPVKPDALKDKLHVEVGGKRVPVVFHTLSASPSLVVRLPSFKAEARTYEARLIVDKGLVPDGGRSGTDKALITGVSIPSPYVLTVQHVESEHDGTVGTVRINTSQQLLGEEITSHIKFEPALSYTVEQTDNGTILRSDKFSVDKSYSLVITKGLRGKIGGVLEEEYRNEIAFGELEADISFVNSKGVYLSKLGNGNMEVRITNTPKVKLIISKVYENNLLMAQRYGYYPDDEDGDEGEYYDEENGEYSSTTAGDVIFTKEIDTRTLPKYGNSRILNLSQFGDRLPEHKGIYHIMLRSASDYWVRSSRFVSLSDMGLIAKQGGHKMVVFANSLKTAASLKGVSIAVYGNNNQLLGAGATNEAGVAEIDLVRKSFTGFKPAMVIARTADDFTYLPLTNTRVNTSRFDVGGKRANTSGLDAFIYAERDIYRPGEKVNFAVMLRDRQWKSPGELPLKLKFLLPNGKELKVFRKTLNEGGILEGSVEIDPAAITGSYSLEVYSSNEVLLASKPFMIEEFVPDRIKVTSRLDKLFLRPGDVASLSINAVSFFGPPAANRNYETEIQIRQKNFSTGKYPGYDFELSNQQSFHDKEVKEGKTDASGSATEIYEVPALYKNVGVLQAAFYTTVFDETGRPVSRLVKTDIYTQDIFNGIKDDGYHYYALNQPVSFSLVALTREGIPTPAPTLVQVIKHEYKTVLSKSGRYFRYESQQEDKLLSSSIITVGKPTTFQFTPRTPGDYEVRVYRPGGTTYVSKRFYSYGGWGSDNRSFEVNNEGHIDIEADRTSYETGQVANLLFKTPFSGRLLVTTEQDGVLSYKYLDVTGRSASLQLKIEGAHLPNFYITATLIKPHEMSDIPLTVAHGFKSLKVEERARRMPVAILSKSASRSHTLQTVKVKAAPNSYVTLAAVDNGVLQVTDFQTPDPYGHYYQKRALEVAAYDMYPLLFPEIRARLSSTGGDGESDMAKRVNPMPAKRVKLLSFWSGIRKTDGAGMAEFSFPVPQFNGQVRLMAVACRGDQFGSAEATVQVADPVVISAALPRFLSPGDTALVPVTLSNTSSKAITAQASVMVSGPLKVVSTSGQSLSIGSNSEVRTLFRLVASPSIGVGKLTVAVQAGGEKFTDVTEISVRPASTLQKVTGGGTLTGGAAHRLAIPAEDFLPSSAGYELVISRSPVTEVADQLRSLIKYPYGCTEQTVSAAFPQLYFGDLAAVAGLGDGGRQTANANVMEAIRRIKMRQLYNGALTLWDGEGAESWWTTVYAAHFLLEARKAGFDVDNSLLETMLGYLTNRLKKKELITYYYNRNQSKKIAPKEVAYSLYVLSLAGRSQVSVMNYYKANPQLLALDSRYLLSAAYAAGGDKRSFNTFLPASFSGEESVPETGGSFYSPTRDEAIALNAILDSDPGHAQVPVLARQVVQRLKTNRYLNTQEAAFSFLALGKIARTAAHSRVTGDVRVNGKVVGTLKDGSWRGAGPHLGGGEIEIRSKGTGRLYYSWMASGISRSGGYREEDNFLKVRRTYFDRNGKPIVGNRFRQNDLIIVALTLEKKYSGRIDNIVITDLLPAGFEIENARTKELPGMDWIKNASEPTALDVRDDRIHFFVDANNSRQTYYYAVRAVSPGHYRQGPVSADAMYNGEMHSYHGAGAIQVLEK